MFVKMFFPFSLPQPWPGTTHFNNMAQATKPQQMKGKSKKAAQKYIFLDYPLFTYDKLVSWSNGSVAHLGIAIVKSNPKYARLRVYDISARNGGDKTDIVYLGHVICLRVRRHRELYDDDVYVRCDGCYWVYRWDFEM